MGDIKFGNSSVNNIYYGSTPVKAVYYGSSFCILRTDLGTYDTPYDPGGGG